MWTSTERNPQRMLLSTVFLKHDLLHVRIHSEQTIEDVTLLLTKTHLKAINPMGKINEWDAPAHKPSTLVPILSSLLEAPSRFKTTST